MWIRELATGWERVYKPSEHASASVTRGTRDAVPTVINLVGYPRVPNNTAPTMLPRLQKLYRTLLLEAKERNSWITLMGDSAWGTLLWF
jgi:acetyl esterase/lipase